MCSLQTPNWRLFLLNLKAQPGNPCWSINERASVVTSDRSKSNLNQYLTFPVIVDYNRIGALDMVMHVGWICAVQSIAKERLTVLIKQRAGSSREDRARSHPLNRPMRARTRQLQRERAGRQKWPGPDRADILLVLYGQTVCSDCPRSFLLGVLL